MPVVFVGILDFTLFKNNNYLNHHFIINKETGECELHHLEFHFIELTKFTKQLEDLKTLLDKWIYFLKEADTLRAIPPSLQEPLLKEAFDVLEQGSWSMEELTAYDKILDDERSFASQIDTAAKEGRQEGRQEGREEGRWEEKMRLAEQLLKSNMLDVPAIAQLTGLSATQIEELKKKKC
jgi:predicted transposase/invertase (TIGR01784 family)